MPSDTHSEIMARLLPLYEQAPQRFLKFYDAVYLMCSELPEGARFRISDRCAPKSVDLFKDIAALCIIEQPFDIHVGQLEFSDDMEFIIRTTGFRSSLKQELFFPKKRIQSANLSQCKDTHY